VHLLSQSQGRLRFDERIAAFVPHKSVQRERSAGASNGSFALHDCLAEGLAAGAAAALGHHSAVAISATIPAVRESTMEPIEAELVHSG
jgi:sarcosine oxidase, subunit alpha